MSRNNLIIPKGFLDNLTTVSKELICKKDSQQIPKSDSTVYL